MATFLQIDQAARATGKSEITVRRLIKSGKISHKKEKTQTGFIYLVDPNEIMRHYGAEPIVIKSEPVKVRQEEVQFEQQNHTNSEQTEPRPIRVAVTGEGGNLAEYWQKRAETYEDRYYKELEKHNQMREELGAWRGRAEQSQAIVAKLLPATASGTKEDQEVGKAVESAPTANLQFKIPAWLSWVFLIVCFVLLGITVYLTVRSSLLL